MSLLVVCLYSSSSWWERVFSWFPSICAGYTLHQFPISSGFSFPRHGPFHFISYGPSWTSMWFQTTRPYIYIYIYI
ncbi:hypothetical protein I7I48_07831 [Histoplasma ohiense]|nr:hypothetical protein I7I48_07831 [Histoplasma ohiense (nom. inval.)]